MKRNFAARAYTRLTECRASSAPRKNPLMISLYNGLLKGKVHELLHVHYGAKEAE